MLSGSFYMEGVMGARFIGTAGAAGRSFSILGNRWRVEKGVLELPDDMPADHLATMAKVLGESYALFPEHEVRQGLHGPVKGFSEGGPDDAGAQHEGGKEHKGRK